MISLNFITGLLVSELVRSFTHIQFLNRLRISSDIVPLERNRSCYTVSDLSMQEAEIIDGTAIAAEIRNELRETVSLLGVRHNLKPGLAFILVGDRRDSATYVRMKRKACEDVGISNIGFTFPQEISQDEILSCILDLNEREEVHGILVQLPLPPHIDEKLILESIIPWKDVDGLHPANIAALCTGSVIQKNRSSWRFDMLDFNVACTPQGCIELLDRSNIKIEGKHAVVIGRSNLVGFPVSTLLLHRNATVTICHSKTSDIHEIVKSGDIVIAAVGKAQVVKKFWLKPGAVVIDVGINSIDDASKKAGYRLVGDVDFDDVKCVASKITPVPGGVGPMTIAMLLRNTINAAVRKNNIDKSSLVRYSALPVAMQTLFHPHGSSYKVMMTSFLNLYPCPK